MYMYILTVSEESFYYQEQIFYQRRLSEYFTPFWVASAQQLA